MLEHAKSSVLIVGAGPTGLVVASELAACGIMATVIDKRNGPTQHSKANVLWPRSLELLARLGLTDRLMRYAYQVQLLRFYQDGEPILVHNFGEFTDTSFPFALTLPQYSTEACIEQCLLERGVRIERGAELLDFNVFKDYVEATIKCSNGVIEQRQYGWLIGADGSNSKVRQIGGIRFEGERVPVTFTLFDAFAEDISVNEAVYHFGKHGSLVITPIGPDLFRFATSGLPNMSIDSPDLQLKELLLSIGFSAQVKSVQYAAQFRAESRQATNYRQGRILLAGDAAHIGTPASGQGMNTGIQDAVNLGWRLSHVLLERLDEAALDIYAQERRSHADKVITVARAQTATVDEKVSSNSLGGGIIPAREMTQLDTKYGSDAIRIPPIPRRIYERFPTKYRMAAPTVLLYPGHNYNAMQWRQEVFRIRAAAPSYFEVADLAGAAVNPRYEGFLGVNPAAFIIRPDHHLQLHLAPKKVSASTFAQLGWRR